MCVRMTFRTLHVCCDSLRHRRYNDHCFHVKAHVDPIFFIRMWIEKTAIAEIALIVNDDIDLNESEFIEFRLNLVIMDTC
jgi:hypothetical protein